MRWIIGVAVVSALAVLPVGFDENLSPSVSMPAQAFEQAQAAVAGQAEALQGETPEALMMHSGGALEGLRKVTETVASTTTSALYVDLPGAAMTWPVAIGDSDLLNVGFSAECRLINAALSAANQDWVELRVVLSRVPPAPGFPAAMQPNDAAGMAFCSANGLAMHHAHFAARVAGAASGAVYTVQVQFRVVNNPPLANPLGVLTARLDDWMLEVAAYN